MSADSFHAFYGLRFSLGADRGDGNPSELEPLELGTDPRLVRAAGAGLDAWWGLDFGGGEYVLLVGRALGQLGAEGELYVSVSDAELEEIRAEVAGRLLEGGFSGRPALQLQAVMDS